MSLAEHRQAIDKLDAQIVKFLNERTRHVLSIGEIKLAAGEEIYREIMSSALALEKTMTIAYFGPEATFTHQAAIQNSARA